MAAPRPRSALAGAGAAKVIDAHASAWPRTAVVVTVVETPAIAQKLQRSAVGRGAGTGHSSSTWPGVMSSIAPISKRVRAQHEGMKLCHWQRCWLAAGYDDRDVGRGIYRSQAAA
jgi:hypothetical protein